MQHLEASANPSGVQTDTFQFARLRQGGAESTVRVFRDGLDRAVSAWGAGGPSSVDLPVVGIIDHAVFADSIFIVGHSLAEAEHIL
jgi:hypothetical protein